MNDKLFDYKVSIFFPISLPFFHFNLWERTAARLLSSCYRRARRGSPRPPVEARGARGRVFFSVAPFCEVVATDKTVVSEKNNSR